MLASELTSASSSAAGTAEMFVQAGAHARESRAPLALAAGAVIVGTAAALVLVLSSTVGSVSSSAVPADGRTPEVALQLPVLTHERTPDGLVVRGVVRNPPDGRVIERLSASVTLLAADGEAIGASSQPVRNVPLRPDDQASFLVALQDIPSVARFRVSFSSGDRVLPHVDTRGPR